MIAELLFLGFLAGIFLCIFWGKVKNRFNQWRWYDESER
jgi:hypothetical protein